MKKMDLEYSEPRFPCRRAYDVEHDKREGDLAATRNTEPSMTQQHFTQDADINEIVRRFGIDGQPVPIPNFGEMYADLRGIPDLRTVLDQARDAKERFLDLPPKLRARFHNNMTEMWEFINDPDNAEEALRLGLLAKIPSSAGADAPGNPGKDTASSTPSATGPDNSAGTPPSPPKG